MRPLFFPRGIVGFRDFFPGVETEPEPKPPTPRPISIALRERACQAGGKRLK